MQPEEQHPHLQHSWRPIEDFSGARTVLVARQGSGRVALAYRHADTWQTGAGPLDFEPTHYSEAPDPPRGSDTPPIHIEPKPTESISIDTESGLGYVAVPADTSAQLPSVSTPESDKSE